MRHGSVSFVFVPGATGIGRLKRPPNGDRNQWRPPRYVAAPVLVSGGTTFAPAQQKRVLFLGRKPQAALR